MRVQGWYWKCEYADCGKQWPAHDVVPPAQCSKCKRRGWHTKTVAVEQRSEKAKVEGSIPFPTTKPDIQALRDICAGKATCKRCGGDKFYGNMQCVVCDHEPAEVPICGKTWWEDDAQYECLMDVGHRERLHGLRGMVRRLDD